MDQGKDDTFAIDIYSDKVSLGGRDENLDMGLAVVIRDSYEADPIACCSLSRYSARYSERMRGRILNQIEATSINYGS